MRRTQEQLDTAAAIDHRRAMRLSSKRHRNNTERTVKLRSIKPGGSADFTVVDAFDAAALRGSAYRTIGRGQCWCEQLSHRTVRVYRDA